MINTVFLGVKKKKEPIIQLNQCVCVCVPLMQTQSLISTFWVCRSTVRVKKMLIIITITLAVLCGLWDFSSQTRD